MRAKLFLHSEGDLIHSASNPIGNNSPSDGSFQESNTDYKLIKRSIMNTSSDNMLFSEDLEIVRMCRIYPKVPKQKPEEIGRNNVLIIHGTQRKNVDGILRHGFKPSAGIFQPDNQKFF